MGGLYVSLQVSESNEAAIAEVTHIFEVWLPCVGTVWTEQVLGRVLWERQWVWGSEVQSEVMTEQLFRLEEPLRPTSSLSPST